MQLLQLQLTQYGAIKGENSCGIALSKNETLNISGGTIRGEGTDGIYIGPDSTSTVNITGSPSIFGKYSGISISNKNTAPTTANINANGGSISGNNYGIYIGGCSIVRVKGANIYGRDFDGITQNADMCECKVSLESGSVQGKNWAVYAWNKSNTLHLYHKTGGVTLQSNGIDNETGRSHIYVSDYHKDQILP